MNVNDIKITLTDTPRQKPVNEGELGFGKIFTDHVFKMDYHEGNGWHNPRIEPYRALSIDPAAMVLHYGQAAFEGLKAYKNGSEKVTLFRPQRNFARLNSSDARLCIPPIDEEFALAALKKLIEIEKEWIPTAPGTSLYIRPFTFATDPFLGVRPANDYTFMIILSPVGAYYPEGLAPVKIYVEAEYVRAVRGGLGFTKAAANYAASLKSQQVAKESGFTQVLWLDGIHRKYIEEVGTMNVFFKIDGTFITPSLGGSILPGITRDSVIQLLKHMGHEVIERQISIDEINEAYKNGKLEEAFGTGTAAVISPIGELIVGDSVMKLSGGEIGPMSQVLYDTLTKIQTGMSEDHFGWVVTV